MEQTMLLVTLVQGAFFSGAVAIASLAWGYRDRLAGLPVFVTAVGASGYTLATLFRAVVSDPVAWQLLNNVRYPLGAIIAVGAFYTAVEFTKREQERRPTVVGLFGAYVSVIAVFAFTDPLHGLVIAEQTATAGTYVGTAGPLFWVHAALGGGIGAGAIGLLLVTRSEVSEIYRQQCLLLVGALSVLLVSFLWQSVAPIHPAFDLATVGIFTYCGLVFWGLFRLDLLETARVSRKTLMERMADPVIAVNRDRTVVDLNPSAMALFDVDEDAVGRSVEQLLAAYSDLHEQLPTTDGSSTAVSLETAGETRHYDIRVSPVTDGTTNPEQAGRLFVFREITAVVERERMLETQATELAAKNDQLTEEIERRKQRERELEETKAELEALTTRFDLALEGATTGIWEWNLEANELIWDEQTEQLGGFEPDTFDGSYQSFIESVHPEDRDRIETARDQARETGRYEAEFRIVDGEDTRWLYAVATVVSETDDNARLLGISQDITERKEREQELQYQTALFEALNESTDAGILVTTSDREMLWYNNRFRDLWGIPPALLDAGNDREALQYVLDSVADPEAFVEATEQLYEPPYEPEEMELQLTDGRWFQRYTAPIVDDDGTRYGLLTLTREITDRKQYERRIERQNERLERLANVISHDLQTPLSTASKHLTLLDIELDDPAEPVVASLADLERTHDRLRKFTEHLPRLARESTSVESTTECELATIATAGWEVVETGTLRLEINGKRAIQADPRRLQQLFENLFGNVVEHAVEAVDEEATTVWVEIDDTGFAVADDGPGIRAGNEIFEYGMSTGDGSGIGLAIVRSIVEAHGWKIDVTDREGGGARFEIATTEPSADIEH